MGRTLPCLHSVAHPSMQNPLSPDTSRSLSDMDATLVLVTLGSEGNPKASEPSLLPQRCMPASRFVCARSKLPAVNSAWGCSPALLLLVQQAPLPPDMSLLLSSTVTFSQPSSGDAMQPQWELFGGMLCESTAGSGFSSEGSVLSNAVLEACAAGAQLSPCSCPEESQVSDFDDDSQQST